MDLATDLGPGAPVVTNAAGGKQSRSPVALDVVPEALLRVGAVFFHGEEKYETAPQLVGDENWRKITAREHVRHSINHLFAWLKGDFTDDHLEHATCRLLMAIEREQEPFPLSPPLTLPRRHARPHPQDCDVEVVRRAAVANGHLASGAAPKNCLFCHCLAHDTRPCEGIGGNCGCEGRARVVKASGLMVLHSTPNGHDPGCLCRRCDSLPRASSTTDLPDF